MQFPPLTYDCVSCGKSCTDFQVEVDAQDVPRLRDSAVTQSLMKQGYEPLQVVNSKVFIEKLEDGRCRYLDEQTLCRLHAEGGFLHKPRTCQTFPFVPRATPDGVYVGLSFYCTAVAESRGRELIGREQEFSYLLSHPDCAPVESDSQWSLWEAQAVDWANYLQIEKFVLAGAERQTRTGLLEAVWRLGAAVSHGDLSYLSRPLGSNQIKTDALQRLVHGLLPHLESVEPVKSQVIAQAIAGEGKFHSLALGHEVVLEPLPSELPNWLLEELTRYSSHVLFRKELLSAPNVLSRACLLAVAQELIVTYSYAQARHRDRSIQAEDFFKAVGLVEGRLMLHANGMEAVIQACADNFLQLSWDDWL